MRLLIIYAALATFLSACGSNSSVSNSGSILPEKASQPAVAGKGPAAPKALVQKPSATPTVEIAKPRILLEPEIMIGQSVVDVREVFGAPSLLRIDNPAEVWQYLVPECALHLFFYPDRTDGQLKVSHISINGRKRVTASELDPKLCFNNYLREIGAEDAFAASGTS
ncbi:hypothetical protein NBZ79_18510 [Sneathiella marina]|uniref:Lipoprotein SmpA/OmlA domain-containing protein n=1 Tax=Sneathiella marina TaxID=2950108 RepID=A0ABY4W1U2_9PROT|nr:hypothetical protein [Sneathiella marina]USG61152.1 hypothetical protein NBZ79_18510 [Sneathiella marina]